MAAKVRIDKFAKAENTISYLCGVPTVNEIILDFREKLITAYDSDELERVIQLAFEHTHDYSRADLVLNRDQLLETSEFNELTEIRKKLESGMPLQYALGYSWFLGNKFKVDPSVLIPRPETEELVNWIFSDNKEFADQELTLLDLCTGSACIPVSVNLKFPAWNVYAMDISEKALEIARENNNTFRTNVHFFQEDILHWKSWTPADESNTAKPNFFPRPDIIVSNPPYISMSERENINSRVKDFEPSLALFVPAEDPLLFYRNIADFAAYSLKRGGKLFLEIDRNYGPDLIKILSEKHFDKIELRKDVFENDRMIFATWPGN
jgi:release factor glutamine methyltransferase